MAAEPANAVGEGMESRTPPLKNKVVPFLSAALMPSLRLAYHSGMAEQFCLVVLVLQSAQLPRDVPTPLRCRNSMISRITLCSAQPAMIRSARLGPKH